MMIQSRVTGKSCLYFTEIVILLTYVKWDDANDSVTVENMM